MPGNLDHAAFGGQVTLEDHEPTRPSEWALDRDHHVLSVCFFRILDLLGEALACGGELPSVYEASLDQAAAQKLRTARVMEVHGGVATAGLEVSDDGGAAADSVEVVDAKRDLRFASYRQQVQDRVRRAATGGDRRDRVLERFTRQDVCGFETPAQEVHDQLSRRHTNLVLARVVSRGARRAHGREAEELERHRHRVRRELATAGASARAGVVLEVLKVLVCHPPRCVGTHGLEDILDRHVPVLESTRGDGSSVDHEAGDAQTDESHRRPRHGLVASYEGDDGVEHMTAAHELYRVRYHLAAYQRCLHPLGAHSNAVGDSNGVELHRRTPGSPDALLDPFGKPTLAEVAGHGFDPGVRHPDYRLAQILVVEAYCFEHRACRGSVAAFEDGAALVTDVGGLHGLPLQVSGQGLFGSLSIERVGL